MLILCDDCWGLPDIHTQAGADEFVRTHRTAISFWVERFDSMGQGGIVTKGAAAYMLNVRSRNMSPNVVAEIDESEWQVLANYIRDHFQSRAQTDDWKQTGSIDKFEENLIQCFIAWLTDSVVLPVLFLKNGGFSTLATSVAVIDPFPPNRHKLYFLYCGHYQRDQKYTQWYLASGWRIWTSCGMTLCCFGRNWDRRTGSTMSDGTHGIPCC